MKNSAPGKDGIREPSGQRAALLPVLSEGSKEKRVVSVLLACMEQVPEFAKALLQGHGAPLGKRTKLTAWTEAGALGRKGADRPDGRIIVESSRGQKWSALLRAKIGKAVLERIGATAVAAMMLFASAAADARATAEDVVDRETLKGFVQTAKAHLEGITDLNEIARLRVTLRTEGDWKSGETFLTILFKNGDCFIHGADPAAESKNLAGVEDDNGLKVVEKLLEAAAEGGGFVEYADGGPQTAYAVEYTSGMTGRTLVVVGGYSQDVSHVPITITELPRPAFTASEVVDRDTLITFVEEAAKAYRGAVSSDDYSGLVGTKNALREEGGHWKDGSVYVWIVSSEGIVVFHGGQRHREGKPAPVHLVDVNGVQFLQELIDMAHRGGGFLEYHFDNPAIDGDEETGSPKIGYATGFPVLESDQMVVVGSGIYLTDE